MKFTSAARLKETLCEKAKRKSEVIQKKKANISIVRQALANSRTCDNDKAVKKHMRRQSQERLRNHFP